MNPRRNSLDEPEHGSIGGRVLLTAAALLAIVATGVLVLSDDLKLMRLGIVAGLWAALVGAFIAARYRRQVVEREDDAAERQEKYEFELEREVAARREHELEVEAEARRRAEEESREDILALRAELQGLRQTLQTLLGGEFLVERYALRAESTRMRSLPEGHPLKQEPKSLAPAQGAGTVVPSAQPEDDTDLINRVPGAPGGALPRRQDRTPEHANARFQKLNPESPAELSDRWFMPGGLEGDQDSDWKKSWESAPAHGSAEPKTFSSRPYANGQGSNGQGANGHGTNGHGIGRTPSSQQSNGQAAPANRQTAGANGRSAAAAANSQAAAANGQAAAANSRAAAANGQAAAGGRAAPSNGRPANGRPAAPNGRAGQSGYTDPRSGVQPAAASSGGMPPAQSSARLPAAGRASHSSTGMPPAAASSSGMSPAARQDSYGAQSVGGRASQS